MYALFFTRFLLFSIFRRLSGGTPLSPPRPPCGRFPYGLAAPADAYARGLRRTLLPSPLTSEFVGMASYAPTTFHELPDDEGDSDSSSINDVAPSHRPSRECAMADAPGQPPAVTQSLQTHALLDPHVETPSSYGSMARNHDNSGCTSHRLRQRTRRTTLRPMRID